MGHIGLDDDVLVIRSVHVTYHLEAAEQHRPVAERVLGFHAKHCPVARTLLGCVEISTELVLEVPAES